MNKEEILQSYLEDDFFVEKSYLKPGEAKTFKWTDARNNNLIKVLRLAIDGVVSNETEGVTTRKINAQLNPKS